MPDADTELRMAYVRCRDLDGELWTIPRGSKLHALLWSDVQLGYVEPYIPVELIREPWRGLNFTLDPELGVRVQAFLTRRILMQPEVQNQVAYHTYRYGQFARLQQRVKVRTSTNA